MNNNDLPVINYNYLESELLGDGIADFSAEILDYPEKVVQIGEGNFLRAFVDWMFHEMNKKGVFKGRAVVVQPIREGRISNLNEQDGLYTLYLRGFEAGKEVNKKEIMTAISRGIESYAQWEDFLKLAENPAIEFVVSNTTEAGITYNEEDSLTDTPPESYPGKLTAYLYRRYQILNGAHTSTVPVSYLAGIDLVRDAVNDELIGKFIKQTVFEDIIPTLDADEYQLEDFASKIFERFKNPYIDHKWLDISLNSTSKFKTRVLPSLIQYIEEYDKVPEHLSFTLAALIHFYHGTELEEGKLVAYRNGEKYLIRDDQNALEYFVDLWRKYEADKISLSELGSYVLANKNFWDRNLNNLPGLTDSLNKYIEMIEKEGIKTSLEKFE